MKNTLVAYNIDAFKDLTQTLTVKQLVKNIVYPNKTSNLKFEHSQAIGKLVVDKRYCNLLKHSCFGKVKTNYNKLKGNRKQKADLTQLINKFTIKE